ncbi:hypothetical protein [Fluviicola sp.]|uniref:hypothetical protein n=1 Tax=Fluviicola sp. TaxID=1917219 RepID=UPI0026121A22|nr:hypothetical protein [Fluviicola sp.]
MSQTEQTELRQQNLELSMKGMNQAQINAQLQQLLGELPYSVSNLPVLIKESDLSEFQRLSEILNRAFLRIVQHYFSDERIRKIYQLDAELEAILKMAHPYPYQVGMYRPDFVIDQNGQKKICEIGCRYPFNGWMFSYYLNDIVAKLIPEVDANWFPVAGLNDFPDDYVQTLNSSEPLFWIHDQEKGTEVNYLFRELKERNILAESITSGDLQVKENRLFVGERPAQQFILEMDREELKRIDPSVLKALVASGKCTNDVRSLILIHDKRVLAVLCNEEIMRDYLSESDYVFLKPFLIQSFIVDTEEKRKAITDSTENWVLKNNSGGRGIGMYVKNECKPEEWNRVVAREWQRYMVQEYIDQQFFDFFYDGKKEQINVVGLLLCKDARCYGPGIFRGSTEKVINMHEGRGVFLPCAIEKNG